MKSKLTVFATIALSIHYAHAVERVWADSAGNTNWTSGASWVAGTAPSNSATTDTATFLSVANAQPHLNVGATTRSVIGIDFQLPAGGLTFTSDAGATLRLGATGIDATTQLSGVSTVNVTNIKVEGSSHEWNLFSTVDDPAPGTTTSTFTVSSNIELASNLTVWSSRNQAGGNAGIVTLSGNIIESGGVRTLTLRGNSAIRNTINLTGTSSYTGTTTITQVSVTANSLANTTFNSALGGSGDIILGTNAAVAYLTFQNLSVNSSTDRLVLLKGTTATNPFIIANNDADNTVAFTNPGNTGDTVGTYTTNLIFGLGGTNPGSNTFGQVINDRNVTNKTSLHKLDAGTWVLTNSNTYTGGTEINGGLLRINNTGALGSGNVALNSGVLGLGAGDLTTLTVGTGAGQVQWTGSGGFAAFGGNRTVHFGTPGSSITWTTTNFIGAGNTLILGHSTADSTLIWDQALNLLNGSRTVQVNDGSAAIDAKMSRFVTGGSTIGANIFNKTGAGTLAFTANNTYNGDTNVNAGTLMIGDGGGTGGTSNATPNIIVASGATLAVNRNNTLTQGTNNLITAISGAGGFAQVGSGTTEFALANSYTGPTTISAGTLKLNASGVLPDTSAVSIGSATLDTANGVVETAGALDVTGTATINLGTAAALAFANSSAVSWTVGTLQLTGAFVSGSSVRFGTNGNGLTPSQLALVSADGFTGFSLNGSGYLTANAAIGFSSWVSGAFSNGTIPDDKRAASYDYDNDGVCNLMEFAIEGHDPTAANSSVGSFIGGILSFAKRPGTSGLTYTIEESDDLGRNDPWTEVAGGSYVNAPATISYTLPGGRHKVFLRLRVSSE